MLRTCITTGSCQHQCPASMLTAKGLRDDLSRMCAQTLVLLVSGSASCPCRAVLASFRARRVRKEGVAIFSYWRDWAHWRALERRAIVAHWHKLMLLVREAVGHFLPFGLPAFWGMADAAAAAAPLDELRRFGRAPTSLQQPSWCLRLCCTISAGFCHLEAASPGPPGGKGCCT